MTQLTFGGLPPMTVPNYAGTMMNFGGQQTPQSAQSAPGGTSNVVIPNLQPAAPAGVSTMGTTGNGLPGIEQVTQNIINDSGMNEEGWFGKIGGMEGVGTILDGLGDLGSIYASLKSLGIAKDQLKLSRESYETNLANQTQSYNTALEDRTMARAAAKGTSQADIDAYLKKHSL